MVLQDVIEDEKWLISQWKQTYPVNWNIILKSVANIFDYYENIEILTFDLKTTKKINIKTKEDILHIKESNALIIKGFSTILKVNILITFYDLTQIVDVTVEKTAEGEFSKADYESFNKSLSQYMDSIEITQYLELINHLVVKLPKIIKKRIKF